MNCSDNYDGGNALGNGEVHSSTLCGSTNHLIFKTPLFAAQFGGFSCHRRYVSFNQIDHFDRNRP